MGFWASILINTASNIIRIMEKVRTSPTLAPSVQNPHRQTRNPNRCKPEVKLRLGALHTCKRLLEAYAKAVIRQCRPRSHPSLCALVLVDRGAKTRRSSNPQFQVESRSHLLELSSATTNSVVTCSCRLSAGRSIPLPMPRPSPKHSLKIRVLGAPHHKTP